MSFELEIRKTGPITFKQIWQNISNVYLRTSWFAMWLFGRLTQKSVAVEGPKEFPKLLCLNVKNTFPSELLISFW